MLKRRNLKGFTLVELLIAISIIAIMSGIMINSNYSSGKARNALLFDIDTLSTDIRDLQTKTSSFVLDNNVNNVGYGLFFDMSNTSKIESFFKTFDGDFLYTGANSEIPLITSTKPSKDILFTKGNYIKRICILDCDEVSYFDVDKVAVYFIRPKPYIYISYKSNSNTSFSTIASGRGNRRIDHICIEIGSLFLPKEIKRIDFYYIGQISISSGLCGIDTEIIETQNG